MARLDRLGTGQRDCPTGRDLGREFSYELLHAVSPLRRRTYSRAEAVSGGGAGLSARAAAAGPLSLQACADSGHGLSIVTQEHPAAVSPADCPGVRGTVSRDQRDTAGTGGASLHRGRLIEQAIPYWQKAGQRASQRSAYVEAISSPHQGAGVAQDPAGHSRAHPARTHATDRPGLRR